ncbi:YpiB family protein [Ammoniphilus sp. CFH 90114]|uniref:YpiB family protein n=1 Tax=Ammoniphilus sp. CFH 90114 TaxID=2493665 RepID=UPI00100E9F90|nr:YpiB family protein [Ammoniphilus sp. CFH 90114]RXT02310.1 IDEAL domain-containing protein [Ammoniphilus sp. CFH 90114]
MSKWVPASDKRKFIRWFMNNYRFKKIEVKKLFDFLLSHDQILERVHFVDKVHPSSRTILISTVCSETIPFEYRKNSKITSNTEEAFQDVKNNHKDRIYILLHFRGKMLSHQYSAVRENFKPQIRDENETPILLRILAEIYLDQQVEDRRLEELDREIDRCLDEGDKELFLKLTEERERIREKRTTSNN